MSSIPPFAGTESEPLDASALAASLTVKNLPASLAWYRDVLGFTVVRTFERAGTLSAASLRFRCVARTARRRTTDPQ